MGEGGGREGGEAPYLFPPVPPHSVSLPTTPIGQVECNRHTTYAPLLLPKHRHTSFPFGKRLLLA